MKVTAVDIVSALQLLSSAALSAQQVQDLYTKPDLTTADVQAVLDQTDTTIARVREED